MMPDWNIMAGVPKPETTTLDEKFAEADQVVQDIKLSLTKTSEIVAEINHVIEGCKK